jgi:ornithine cyclodeaminase
MRNGDILIVTGREVLSLLEGKEAEIVETVRRAYVTHCEGGSSLPHSTFLRFPGNEKNRIIALPAYLGDGFSVAGMKWVASFPGNLEQGMDRASAVIILNSAETGRAEAIIEGSIISARRTAASAALAARSLRDGTRTTSVGFVGCGPINFEIARFLLALLPEIESFVLFDKHPEKARRFKDKTRDLSQKIEVILAEDVNTVFRQAPLTSFATTAISPHVADLSSCAPGSTILHVSLRDLAPEMILHADNVVDDVDHVCRAQTSIHLAEQVAGNRDFIRCTLADILLGHAPARRDARSVSIFSPFGLGVLDVAVGQLLFNLAQAEGQGTTISSFIVEPWAEQS